MPAPSTHFKVVGLGWKQIQKIFFKENSAWREISRAYTKVPDLGWKLVFLKGDGGGGGGEPGSGFTVIYSQNVNNVNPWVDAGSPSGNIFLNVIIKPSVTIASVSTSSVAMDFTGIDPSSQVLITMENFAAIIGKGGSGGQGGSTSVFNDLCVISGPDVAQPGEPGGTALRLACNTTIEVVGTSAQIIAGFGGGHGGASSCVNPAGAGGGGGGGFINGSGGSGGIDRFSNQNEPQVAGSGNPGTFSGGGAGGQGLRNGSPGVPGAGPNQAPLPFQAPNGLAISKQGFSLNFNPTQVAIVGDIA